MTLFRHLWKGVAVGLFALVIAASIGVRGGLVAIPFDRPDGPLMWNIARVAGITAYLSLTAAVSLGMMVSSGLLDRWVARARCLEIHRWITSVMLALVATHAVAFLGDRVARFDALDVVVPFLSPYRPVAVGLGILATYLVLAVHVSGPLRATIGKTAWRVLHVLSFPAFWLVSAHGILAGSDAHLSGIRLVYLACSGLVLALIAVRIGEHLATPARSEPRIAR
jgi:predicted ferric reductase